MSEEEKKVDNWQKVAVGVACLLLGGGGATQIIPSYEKDFEYMKQAIEAQGEFMDESLKRLESIIEKQPQKEDIVKLQMEVNQIKMRLDKVENN